LHHTNIGVLRGKIETKEHRSWMLEHLPKLDLHVVVLLFHLVDFCTVALKTFPGFANCKYFNSIIGAE
jgi:hypothetical protein